MLSEVDKFRVKGFLNLWLIIRARKADWEIPLKWRKRKFKHSEKNFYGFTKNFYVIFKLETFRKLKKVMNIDISFYRMLYFPTF